jgi:hypothetical protein
VEDCRVPEVCFLQIHPAHLEKIVAGAWSAIFDVEFHLLVHADYEN